MSPEYISLRVRSDVVANMRSMIRRVSYDGDRDVPQSDVIGAALEVSARHYDELAAALGIKPRDSATPQRTEQD